MLLLMIDVFYQTYPDYSKLFEDYIEEEFTCSKVFFALTKQVTQIGQAFEEDFKDLDRTWLVQTLSYFHLILKIRAQDRAKFNDFVGSWLGRA